MKRFGNADGSHESVIRACIIYTGFGCFCLSLGVSTQAVWAQAGVNTMVNTDTNNMYNTDTAVCAQAGVNTTVWVRPL